MEKYHISPLSPLEKYQISPQRVDKKGTYKEDIAKNKANNSAENQHQYRNAFALPGWIPSDLWNDFLDSRTKKPTAKAKALLVKKLEQLAREGEDIVQVIEQSIMHGWSGFFPVNDPAPTETTATRQTETDAQEEIPVQEMTDQQKLAWFRDKRDKLRGDPFGLSNLEKSFALTEPLLWSKVQN